METSAITANFQALMGIASVLTIILLTLFAFYGLLKPQWGKLCSRLGSTLVLFAVLVFSAKPLVTVGNKFEDLYLKLKISDVIEKPVATKIFTSAQNSTPRNTSQPALEQILATGVLKVGYNTVEIPYCYYNLYNELAGFDMAYAFQFASDLDCRIEFVPTDFDDVGNELNRGDYDIGMAAFLMTEERLKEVNFTEHYSVQNAILVVPTKKKDYFLDLNQVTDDHKLTIGAFGAYGSFIDKHFPNATKFESSGVDTEAMRRGEVDAWIWVRDLATTWCLSHPDFVVIDYGGRIGKTYFAYAIRNDDYKLVAYLNNSMIIKELSGFRQEMYDYWIKGESVARRKPRWSILRNVLKINE
jgi:ABC-type amino acid transport substrate-binding protein